MNVGVRTRGATPGTYLFLTPDGAGSGIYGPGGTLVWWQQAAANQHEHDARVVQLWGQPYLAIWRGGASTNAGSSGTVLLYDEHYRQVGTVSAGAPYLAQGLDLHEFSVTPQGNALVGIDFPTHKVFGGRVLTVVDYVVQEISLIRTPTGIHTGRVLFTWDSLRDVPLSQSHTPPPSSGPWDYFHGNAVAQDTDGNLLVSARNTWGIYKISLSTGHVMWEVGAKGDHTLRRPWCYQHNITTLGGNEYSLFDDGGLDPGCQGPTGHPARGIIFRVIPSGPRPQIRLVHAFTHDPPLYSDWMGSMQVLPDRHVLIDWGTAPEVTEYAPGGRRANLDLSLSHASYRAFSFPWVGQPRTPPAVAATDRSGKTDLWASWNGSTQVVAWRVLAGRSASSLTAVTGARAKRGFETSILLRHPYAYVAAQALGSTGQVLATSSAVVPGSG